MKNHIIEKDVIAHLDAFARENNIRSMTSSKYRNDLIYFIVNNHERGDSICEVGCYRGGLSIILAYLAQQLGKKLVICEIDENCARLAGNRIAELGLADIVSIHTSCFAAFVASGCFPDNCILTIIDANHIYEEAKTNFSAFRSVDHKSYAVAFHDYGLRDTGNKMGIQRAVNDVYPLKNIFHIGDNTLFSPCENHTEVAEDTTYFQGSEGALIILREELSEREKKVLHLCHDVLGACRRARIWDRNKPDGAARHGKTLGRQNATSFPPVAVVRPPIVELPGGLRLVNGKYGHFFVLGHDTGVGRTIAETGVWADEHVRLFRSFLPAGGTAFDVGANIGHHSVALARIAGDNGRVFALEPQTAVFEILCANAAVNACRNIVPLRVLAGESSGSLALPALDYAQDENFGALCVENKAKNRADKNDALKIPLDSLLDDPAYGIERVDFIKIDVQTFELYVLMGAERILETYHPALLIEISPYWMKRINKYDYRDIYALLQTHHYSLFDASLRPLTGTPADPESFGRDIEWDIVALHGDAAASVGKKAN